MAAAFLRDYARSFRLGAPYAKTLLTDIAYWAVIVVLFQLGVGFLRRKAFALTGGLGGESFQQFLLSMPLEQLQQFSGQLKVFFFQFVGFIILFPVLALLLYSLSQSFLWGILLGKPFSFRRHWRWNLLHLLFVPIGIALLAVLVLVRGALFFFISHPVARDAVNGLLLLALLIVFLIILFGAQHRFAASRKVFSSTGAALRSVTKGKTLLLALLAFLTMLALQLAQFPFREQLFIHPTLSLSLNAALFVLWMAWLRVYAAQRAP